MNKNKLVYNLKRILFIIHFYLMLFLIPSILKIGITGYIFLLIYFIYILRIILNLLKKKKYNKYDLIYNGMQIGFFFYIGVVAFKVYHDKISVIDSTLTYFRVNYIIFSLLLVFILLYDSLGLNK